MVRACQNADMAAQERTEAPGLLSASRSVEATRCTRTPRPSRRRCSRRLTAIRPHRTTALSSRCQPSSSLDPLATDRFEISREFAPSVVRDAHRRRSSEKSSRERGSWIAEIEGCRSRAPWSSSLTPESFSARGRREENATSWCSWWSWSSWSSWWCDGTDRMKKKGTLKLGERETKDGKLINRLGDCRLIAVRSE